MSRPQPQQRLPVGVVVERRQAKGPWIDFVWQPTAVLPGAPDAVAWTVLSETATATSFFAGACELELFVSSSTFYRDNLATDQPLLWVVLRPTGIEPPFEIVTVTADPHEGEAFTEAGNDLVEAVAMPEPIRHAVNAFVAAHPVESAFFKRKRDHANPEALARRAPATKRDDDG